jgi:uncharacterized protein (TIGR03435 family)
MEGLLWSRQASAAIKHHSAITLMLALAVAIPISANGQQRFDVASLKALPKENNIVIGNGGSISILQQGWRYSPRRVTCVLPLRELVKEALDVKDWQVSGPAFLDGDYQSLEATMAASTSRSEARPMILSLLEERYKFKFHREEKIISTYSLQVEKGGFKVPRLPDEPQRITTGGGRGHFIGYAITMAQLASALTARSERPVIDDTEMPGKFNFDISWSPEPDEQQTGAKELPWGLIEAFRSQVGLRLEPRKSPQSIIVVDHIEKTPTPN